MPYAAPKHRPPGWKSGGGKITDPFYGSVFWQNLRQRVRLRDRGICRGCGRQGAWRVDHIKPRSEGGADAEWNLRLLCNACDGKRHADKGRAWKEA